MNPKAASGRCCGPGLPPPSAARPLRQNLEGIEARKARITPFLDLLLPSGPDFRVRCSVSSVRDVSPRWSHILPMPPNAWTKPVQISSKVL